MGTALAVAVLIGFNEGLGQHFQYIVEDPEQVVKWTKVSILPSHELQSMVGRLISRHSRLMSKMLAIQQQRHS